MLNQQRGFIIILWIVILFNVIIPPCLIFINKMEENLKLKKLLKHLYEDKVFHMSFKDEVTSWNDDEVIYDEYSFTYKIDVDKVYGDDDKAVASFDLIITDLTRDDEDYMLEWENDGYSDRVWYINEFESLVLEEMTSEVPISIYLTIWSIHER